jgi:hypothetical protein
MRFGKVGRETLLIVLLFEPLVEINRMTDFANGQSIPNG